MKTFFTKQIGGPDVDEATLELLRVVGSQLASAAATIEAADFDKINFRLRVSGEISTFNTPSGFNGSLLQVPRRTALVDITIQRDVWSRGTAATRQLLVTALKDGLLDADRKAKAKGLDLQSAALLGSLRELATPDLAARTGRPSTGPQPSPKVAKPASRETPGGARAQGKPPPSRR